MFIALWNSVIKKEYPDGKKFIVVYSHSLFVTGIVQMIATLLTMYMTQNQGGQNGGQNYDKLLQIFGLVLVMASVPMIMIVIIGKKVQASLMKVGLQNRISMNEIAEKTNSENVQEEA